MPATDIFRQAADEIDAMASENEVLKARIAAMAAEDTAEDALFEERIAAGDRRVSELLAEDAAEDEAHAREVAALRAAAVPVPPPAEPIKPPTVPAEPATPEATVERALTYEDIIFVGGKRCWFHGAPGKPNPKAPLDQQARLKPRPWNLQYRDDEYYCFETRAYFNPVFGTAGRWEEDRAPFDNESKVRSELCWIDKDIQPGREFTFDFEFMIEEGPITERAWLIPFQLHQDDPSAARARGAGASKLANSIGSSPFFGVNIVKSKDGKRELLRIHGDTSPVSPLRGFPKWRILSNHKDNTVREVEFTRGERHRLRGKIIDNNGADTAPFLPAENMTPQDGHWGRQGNWGQGTGLCKVWYDEDVIADHEGIPMGYGYASPESGGIGSYPKLGIYAGARTGLPADGNLVHPDPRIVAHYWNPRFTFGA